MKSVYFELFVGASTYSMTQMHLSVNIVLFYTPQ